MPKLLFTPSRRGRTAYFYFVVSVLLLSAGLLTGLIQNFFYLVSSNRIYPVYYSLYEKYTGPAGPVDTPLDKKAKSLHAKSSGYVYIGKAGDLIIEVPNAEYGRYKILFFDDWNRFLFEVRQIRDPYLIIEKQNFLRTGLFQYELYRDNMLVERNTFLIKKE